METKRTGGSIINEERGFQNKEEEEECVEELSVANKELAFQNEEKNKRAAELVITKGTLKKTETDCEILNKKLIKEHEKLLQSEAQVRNFAKHLNQVMEDERAYIAREIHDELGQKLAVLKMNLSLLKGEKRDRINAIIENVNETIQSLRKIATELRPGILDTLGIIPAIQWLADEFQKKNHIKCSVKLNVKKVQFEKNISICLFRICQEALTNVSKHAEATEVKITITEKDDELTLEVSDNGKGISSKKLENPFSMGLLGMKERANIIGAEMKIFSKKGAGTTIYLKTAVK